MKRCPACRARISEKCDACERCGCDLSMLMCIENQADYLLRQALSAIQNEQLIEAKKILLTLNQLKHSPLTFALLNFVDISLNVTTQKLYSD